MTSSLAITAYTGACALGPSPASWRRALDLSLSGLSRTHRFPRWHAFPLGQTDISPFRQDDYGLGAVETRMMRLCLGLLTRLVAEQALHERYQSHELGIFIGTTTAGLSPVRDAHYRSFCDGNRHAFSHYLDHTTQHGNLLNVLQDKLRIHGYSLLLTNSCAAGASAMAEAKAAVDSGVVRAAIAGGGDILDTLTLAGFDSLQILNPEQSQSFAPERRGINLGEGAAFFLLERDQGKTGAKPIAFLRGAGQSSDTYHMTHPEPSGRAMAEAMREALRDASCKAAAVTYVNTHGTGTLSNDSAEYAAIHQVWPDGVLYSATKPLHGHLLAGSGPLELAVCLEGLKAQRVWGRSYFRDQFLGMGQDHQHHTVLSNSFGFGGTNVSLVVSQQEGP